MKKTRPDWKMRGLDTPVGPILLAADGEGLCYLGFGSWEAPAREQSPFLDQAERELREYFSGKRRDFTVPLHPQGTDFQLRVWEELRRIPYGETATYGEIARRIGKPGAARAVGMANHRNPLSLFVPCHRVIGADGRLVGYGGGLETKRALLQLEGCHVV